MKFIREDGNIYDPKHEDTIDRLKKSDRFKKLDDVNVKDLKDYAKKKDISGYSSMTRSELITVLEEGG